MHGLGIYRTAFNVPRILYVLEIGQNKRNRIFVGYFLLFDAPQVVAEFFDHVNRARKLQKSSENSRIYLANGPIRVPKAFAICSLLNKVIDARNAFAL